MIFSLILEAFWEPGLLTFCFLVAPVANTCLILGSQFPSLIFSVKSDVEESRNGGQGGLLVEVGGRSGASGGRGRLRLRALKGFVSHVQHALLPLDEVRRIYVAFGEHPAAGGLYMSFWSLWHFAGPCGVSLALWVALGLHCGTLGFHFDTHGV